MGGANIRRRDGWAILGLAAAVLVSVMAFMGATSDFGSQKDPWLPRGPMPPAAIDAAAQVAAPVIRAPESRASEPLADPEPRGLEGHRADGVLVPTRSLQLGTWRVAGRVEDLWGAPVSGLGIRSSRDPSSVERASSDAAGRFSISVPAVGTALLHLTAGSPFVLVASSRIAPDEEDAVLVVCHPRPPLTVQVFDKGSGLPLAHAAIEVKAPSSIAGLSPVRHAGPTDVQGLCVFTSLPGQGALRVEVQRPGFLKADRSLPSASDGDGTVEVFLTALVPTEPGSLSGRVLDEDGSPASGVEVAAGRARTRSRADGSFELHLGAEVPNRVHGYHPRSGTGEAPVIAAPIADGYSPVTITLGPEPHRAAAPLVDAQGQSLGNVRVVPIDGHGHPDPLAAHWLTAQSGRDGQLALPESAFDRGDALRPLAVIDKDGVPLGRLVANGPDLTVQSFEFPVPNAR